MYLVLTDETNTNARHSTFFLVGGIAVPSDSTGILHVRMEEIRERHGYRPSDSFKYARSNKPAHITEDQFNSAKSQALDLLHEHEVTVFVYACHHLIAENRTKEEKFRWGNNALLWLIQKFLEEHKSYAWIIQDRHPVGDEFRYYVKRFTDSARTTVGVTHKLRNIIGFGSTCDGASHIASLADIALGSYRFCINHPDKDIVNGILMPKLLRATWGYPNPLDRGFGIFPRRRVHKPECIADYQRLKAHIAKYLPS